MFIVFENPFGGLNFFRGLLGQSKLKKDKQTLDPTTGLSVCVWKEGLGKDSQIWGSVWGPGFVVGLGTELV